MVRKQLSYQRKHINKTRLYLSFGEMGHHALAERKHLSISQQWRRSYGSMGNVSGREGGCGWLERQRGLKASMGSIIVCKRGVV